MGVIFNYIEYALGIILPIINTLIVVKCYMEFLKTKDLKLPAYFTHISFALAILLSRFVVTRIFLEVSLPYQLFNTIIIASTTFFLSLLLYRKELGLQIFLPCCIFAVQEISYLFSISLSRVLAETSVFIANGLIGQGLLSDASSLKIYYDISIIFQMTLSTLSYVFICIWSLKSISKNFVYKRHLLRLSEILFLVLPCLVGLLIIHIIKAIFYKPEGNGLLLYDDVPYIAIYITVACFLLLLSIIASVILFQKLIELHLEERDKVVLKKQMHQLQEQIHDVDNIYSEIRGMRHDMKSHLSNIQILVGSILEGNQNVVSELEEYLGKLGDTLNKFEFTYKTGNSISDVIIHQKYIEALDNKIAFSSDFLYPTRLNLDAYDLAVILNNALENAIEACNSVSEADRYVRVYSYAKGEMFFIEVENSFTGRFMIDEHTALPVSKKDDKTAHGIGLSNVQRCARNYYGDIDFRVSDMKRYKIFRLTVMLQSRN